MARILVTGGAGFIGTNLVNECSNGGTSITCII
jgi:nucleoside-diphosphate-sugar epimerase